MVSSKQSEQLFEPAKLLRLEPGDVLVYRTQNPLPAAVRNRAKAQLEAAFPGVEVLILERGDQIEIVRRPSWWRSLFGGGA